jgi:uncharacterized membrane protein
MPNFAQPIMTGSIPNPTLMLTAQVQQTMQSWQGPYPPPEAVERYEKLLPGTFDRMIKMAEQLQHAQIEEAKEVRAMTHKDQQRGNYLGFATAAVAMSGGLICLYLNSPWLGAVFLSVPVMGVAKALIESASLRSLTTPRPEMTVPAQAVAPPPPTPTEPLQT